MTEVVFVTIFDALSNAAYRVSLHGPGAQLEGGYQQHRTPPHLVVDNIILEAQRGAG